jgi:protein ImuB
VPRVLVVWCPSWPLTAAGIPSEVPAVVVGNGQVVAASLAARTAGVRPGMRRREAEARCPEAVVLARDPLAEARAFEPVVRALEAFGSPVEVCAPGWAALGTRGPARRCGGERGLACAVAAALRELPPPVASRDPLPGSPGGRAPARAGGRSRPALVGEWWRVGIADGLFAATLAARSGRVVGPGGTREFLAPFPVEVLRRPRLAELLRRLGVATLGALAALPSGEVAARFGAEGAEAQRLAMGLDDRPVAGRPAPFEFAVAARLDPPAERVETVAFATRSLARDLQASLAGRGLRCSRLSVELESEEGERHRRTFGGERALTPSVAAERVRWQVDAWLGGRDRPTAGIVLVRLAAEQTLPDRGEAVGLFGEERRNEERLERTVARLQGLVGPDQVGTFVVGGGRDPRSRARFVPWGGTRPEEAARPWPGGLPSPSPAVVEPEPLPAEVLDATERAVVVSGRGLASAPPARVAFGESGCREVAAWAGPWPAEERWWDRTRRRRRAWLQVVLSDRTALLLACERGRWWVEALYD